MKQLYLKDCLARNMNALRTALGPSVDPVAPPSWNLPSQHRELLAYIQKHNTSSSANAAASVPNASDGGDDGSQSSHKGSKSTPQSSSNKKVFIVKPAAGLQGHGISLTTFPLEAAAVRGSNGKTSVIQHYIDPPLLLEGFKFDLRLYVLITSVDPLKIYLYNDGLVRLCTTPYCSPTSTKSMNNRNAHLTNYSLNKKSKNFVKGPDGSKRSVQSVFDTLRAEGTRGSY